MFQGMSEKDKRKIMVVFLYVGVTGLVYLFLRYILYLAAPFLVALFIAWALNRPVTWMKKKLHFPRVLSGVVLLVLVFAGLALSLFYLGRLAVREVQLFMGNYGFYLDCVNQEALQICGCIDRGLGLVEGSSYEYMDLQMKSVIENGCNSLISKALGHSVGFTKECIVWIAALFIALTAALFLIHDFEKVQIAYREGTMSDGLKICFGKMFRFGIVFLRTQLVIMVITTGVCTVGLLFLGNDYAIIIGIGVGLLDALPVFGTGTVLIPWTIIALLWGKYMEAAVIFSVYLICYSVREILEPKLMGHHMGIHPVVMLLTMYVGVILFGVSGFLLGPAAYIMITEITDYLKKVL